MDFGLRPKMISFGVRIRSLNVEGFMDFNNPICIIGVFIGRVMEGYGVCEFWVLSQLHL